MPETKPLDDLRNLISQLPDVDEDAAVLASAFMHDVVIGSAVAPFEHLTTWLAGWQAQQSPKLDETHICILVSSYAGHGKIDNVLDFVDAASKGRAPINLMCKERGLGLRVLEMAPTVPHLIGRSWREEECMAATAFGMEATASGGDLLGIASFAPGAEECAPKLIKAIEAHKISENPEKDALDLMREFGGREIAGIVGALLAARSRRLPVLIEGWSALAALKVLYAANPMAIDHVQIACVANDQQAEVADQMNKVPIIGPKVILEQGCGIAIAVSAIAPLLQLIRKK